MSANGKMFRVSKWLPGLYVEGDERFSLDADLTPWILHYAQRGIKTEIRHRATDGRIALFREGADAFPDSEHD